MNANRAVWVLAFGLLAVAGTANAQQRMPYYCKDARTAPKRCAQVLPTPTRP